MWIKLTLAVCLLVSVTSQVVGQEDELINILEKELDREFELLSKNTPPVYYISYNISDLSVLSLEASFGSLMDSDQNRSRILNTNVRVGDYSFDNSHNFQGSERFSRYSGAMPLPLENIDEAIRQTAWMATDMGYKVASSAYTIAQRSEKNDTNTTIDDFSKEDVVKYIAPELTPQDKDVDVEKWINNITTWSKAFLIDKDILEGSVNFSFVAGQKYFMSTEGSRVRQNELRAEIQISASIRSSGGHVIPLHQNYFAKHPRELPSAEKVAADIDQMLKKLEELKTAPVADPFAGPAIFSGRSAGVFFHEIFGHRVEADRLKSKDDAQTFKDKIGKKVLPKFIDVTFDPTSPTFEGKHLTGSYEYDDQGVKSQKVESVDNGILKDFLRSRKPLVAGQHSNGHSRAQTGLNPVSRQSNLIVSSENQKDEAGLRKMLIKECKKQDKEFGYYIKNVQGGYTMTDRYTPNAFSITPTEVYKVFADGRPDQLVRGVDLIGTPLTMFSEIQATGTQSEIFYGYCGAESGYVPVTAIAPAIFVRKIETQKKPEENMEKPILANPANLDK
ncbi:MAG: TldD/PmbA family protein [Bacteroidota bacterium]